MKRSKAERKARRLERKKKKQEKKRKNFNRYLKGAAGRKLPCALCKEIQVVGSRDVMRVFCGVCIQTDPYGIQRVKQGRTVLKITMAKKLLAGASLRQAKRKRIEEIRLLMKEEKKKEKKEWKKDILKYIARRHDKKKFREEQGKTSRGIKKWIKL